jgi:outer membrane protein TolC
MVALTCGPAFAQEAPLTFESAIQLATSRNERARIADLNIVVAAAGVEKARSGFLPVATLNSSDTQRPYQVEKAGVVTQPSNIGVASLTLNQPLINASAFPLYSQAKETLAGQQAQSADDRRVLAFDAAQAFFGVVNAQEVLEAAQRKMESAKANLADTQARVDAQLTGSNDATRAQIDLAGAARDLETDRGVLGDATEALAFVLNSPVPTPLTPPAATLQASLRPVTALPPLLALGLARRLDLEARRRAVLAAHDFAFEPLMRTLPTLGLLGTASGTTNSATSGRAFDEFLALSLTWVLYDAGSRYADLHSRRAAEEIADLQARQLARQVESDVRTAVVTLTAAQAAAVQAHEAAQAARKSAVETNELYKQGLAKAIELVDANDQLFLAEVSDVQARNTMAESYLSLRQALGLDPQGTELQ